MGPKMYAVEIEGTKDYLHACLKPEMLYPGAPKPKPTRDSIAEGWKKIVRWNPQTKVLFTPAAAIERACREAASLTKMKSQSINVAKLVLSGMFIEEDEIPFLGFKGTLESFANNGHSYVLEACYRNPRSGAGVSTRLALKAGWRLKFRLNVLHDELNEEIIQVVLDRAGRFIGIGSWRPRYGRFRLLSLKAV